MSRTPKNPKVIRLTPKEQVRKYADLLFFTARSLHRACGLGNRVPIAEEKMNAMENPRPGDMVFENSCPLGRVDSSKRIGRLIIERDEQLEHKDWKEGDDEDDRYYTDKLWYIELLDGTLFQWNNAHIIALPDSQFWFWSTPLPKSAECPTPQDKAKWAKAALIRHNLRSK